MTTTPFTNEKGEIVIDLKPLRDIVLLYVPPPPDKFEGTTLVMPEQIKDKFYKPEAIVLAVGPGYYGKDGVWREVSKELKPGIKVTFDLNVPWRQRIKGLDGKEYIIVMCTEHDIQCVIGEKPPKVVDGIINTQESVNSPQTNPNFPGPTAQEIAGNK